MMSKRLQQSLLMEERSTLRWVAGWRNFFPPQRAGKDGTGAIFYSNSVATGSISFELVPSWKRFPHGAGRSFSALLTMWSSRLPTKLKSEASNRVFRIWCGGGEDFYNKNIARICFVSP